MWFDAANHRANGFTPDSIRHEAQQQDRLTSYGWLRHDGRSYGRQQLIDGDFNITLQMVRVTNRSPCIGTPQQELESVLSAQSTSSHHVAASLVSLQTCPLLSALPGCPALFAPACR